MIYVQIAVNIPAVSGVFDYALPPELEGTVGVGHLVTVPFSHQVAQGVVLRFIDQPSVPEVKTVIDLLDPLPVLTAAQIALAESMAAETLNPLAAMVALMLPSGLSQQADVEYTVMSNPQEDVSGQIQRRLLNLLEKRGPLRGRQLDRHFKNIEWRKSAQALVRRGIVSSKTVLPAPKVRPKFVRTAQLAVPPQAALAVMDTLGQTEATQRRRAAALQYLVREPEATAVSWIYAESGCNLSDLQILAEKDLIVLQETEIWRDPVRGVEIREAESREVKLTAAQQALMEEILASFAAAQTAPLLLHGVTGSGKTEIYIRAAQEAVQRGGQALILVPEIALTAQTVRRFLARFPGQVGLIHSRLSTGERYDTWRRARSGQLKVVIGPRSALFTPLPRVKLIVLDECHDNSYHQSQPPFYDALRAAQEYAEICGAVPIFGSATPPITLMHWAKSQHGLHLLRLPERIGGRELPPVDVIDMRAELKSGNRGIFSRVLQDALAQTLARGEQAILFLNRRGNATYVFCRECGYTLKCPRCETPLTHHVHTLERSNVDKLLCHRCGYSRQMPRTCPQCGGTKIRAYGLGSQRVEQEVGTLFPEARVLRWDRDTTRAKGAHEMILSHFSAHRAEVLVGTQMLAKGLDLPLVTLVGVVLADVGLNLPDPFAAERVFQTLTQVAGRAGRSARGGRVVLQTFAPEHPVIRFAAEHDLAGFHAHELRERRRLGYPPFARLVRLEFRSPQPVTAEEETRKLAAQITAQIKAEGRKSTSVIGPVPCFFSKVDGQYRWQIVVRGPEPSELLRGLALSLSRGWRVDVDPVSLL